MRLHKQLEELRNDSAQTEVLAAKTDRESEEFRKAESEKAGIVAELNAESVRLAGEKRALEKQIARQPAAAVWAALLSVSALRRAFSNSEYTA